MIHKAQLKWFRSRNEWSIRQNMYKLFYFMSN